MPKRDMTLKGTRPVTPMKMDTNRATPLKWKGVFLW